MSKLTFSTLLLCLASSLLSGAPASALGIRGQLGNPDVAQRLMGSPADTYVLFGSFTQVSMAGWGQLRAGRFFLNVPETQALKLRQYQACDGVSISAPVKVYQAETIMLYNPVLDRAVGPLIQADTSTNPSKVVRWMYSDRSADVRGHCTGTNTRYDMHINVGWTAVMTRTDPLTSALTYSNVYEPLPYWVAGSLIFDHAHTTLLANVFRLKGAPQTR